MLPPFASAGNHTNRRVPQQIEQQQSRSSRVDERAAPSSAVRRSTTAPAAVGYLGDTDGTAAAEQMCSTGAAPWTASSPSSTRGTAAAAAAEEDISGYDVYVISRTFREWGGGLYRRLPGSFLNALSDVGVCHFMVVVQDPSSGASVQFDFGPPEGDVSSAMLSGVLSSTGGARRGEIRENHRQARDTPQKEEGGPFVPLNSCAFVRTSLHNIRVGLCLPIDSAPSKHAACPDRVPVSEETALSSC